LITVAKRDNSGKGKRSRKAKAGRKGKAAEICEKCGHVLAAGALCLVCLGQGVSAEAQAKPTTTVTHPVVLKQAPAQQVPPLYSTLGEQRWRPGEAPDDHDQPERDATFPWGSEVSVTGTASTFDVNGGPVRLPWNPYGD
jgi:ribosomal protein L32